MIEANPSLAEQAYHLIEALIVTLKLPPGKIISEMELSRLIDIGRTPTREAIQRLAGERLLKYMPRRGVIVMEINMTEHLALLETRRVLDRLIAERASVRANEEERAAILEHAQIMADAAGKRDLDMFMRQDHELDNLIGAACRNSFAARAVEPLHAHCRRFWYMHRNKGDFARSAVLHQDLMRAVADHNGEAAGKASDALLDYLDEFTRAAMDLF